jgi:hypothetical protein
MKKMLAVACAATGLMGTWDAAQADPTTFSGTLTPSQDLSNVYFLFTTGACSAFDFAAKIADHLSANVTTPYSVTMDIDPKLREGTSIFEHFMIAGIYNTTTGGVTLSYNNQAAPTLLSLKPSWGVSGLPVFGDPGVAFDATNSEATVAADLEAGLSATQPNVLTLPLADSVGVSIPLSASSFTLISYSAAASAGTGTLTSVVTTPEPAAALSLFTGGTLLHYSRRRRPC